MPLKVLPTQEEIEKMRERLASIQEDALAYHGYWPFQGGDFPWLMYLSKEYIDALEQFHEREK